VGVAVQAVVQTRYGASDDVLALRDVARPVPRAGEVLVRVRAASLHPDVWHVVTGRPYMLRLMGSGVRRPKRPIPGSDVAGIVEAVGPGAGRFQPGDAVFGETHHGMQWVNGGAFAEYVAAPEDALARVPAGVALDVAATVPTAGIIALLNLREAEPLRPGQRVLVNGTAGGVGSIVVQIAKARGAHVTGVDDGAKLELVRALGADDVVDYRRHPALAPGARYDLIFDVASTLPFAAVKRALTRDGIYVIIGHDDYGRGAGRIVGGVPRVLSYVARAPFSRHLRANLAAIDKRAAMQTLADLLAARQLTPVVGRRFPLAAVHDAMRCLVAGRTVGRIVLTA
jgi:NADPH:quinone reductase-like Zn-dependent oxidoreductase